MKKVLVGVVLSFVLLPICVDAQDYYVDATNGDNGNLGTSPGQAWKTISKVNSMIFNPGDNVLFKRGEIWREKLTIPSPGSSGYPITFTSYGTGNKPKILGSVAKNSESDWTNGGGNLWYASFTIEIWGIVFDNEGAKSSVVENKVDLDTQGESWWDSANSRIYIYSTSNPAIYYNGWIECQKYDWYIIDLNDKSYITIDGLDLRYVGKSAIYGYSKNAKNNIIIRNNTIKYVGNNRAKWPGGRFFGRAIITGTATDITIDNNNISHIAAGFNHFGDGTSTLVFTITNNTISDLHGYAGNVDGIGFGSPRTDYNGTIISSNDISGFGDEGVDLYFAKNVIVSDNVIHDSVTLDGSGSEAGIKAGGAYDAEYGLAEGHQFLRNHIYNCKYGVLSNSGANVIFAYNVIHDISSHGIWVYTKGANGENDNWKIYNNVVKAGNRAIYSQSGIDGDEMSITIQNNIADGTNYDIYLNKYVDCTGGYNCLLNDASVRKGTGSTYNGSAYDLYQTDPLFVDAANWDFYLQPGSPCIDAGIDVGLTQDFEGTPVPQGSAPDIGAYEYQSPVTGNVYYVDATNGNNSNDGLSEEAAWKTIQKAADSMVAGDTCIVLPRFYDERVQISRSGTYGAPITFQAAGSSVVTKGFEVQKYGGYVEYIIIDGFEIANTEGQWGEGQGVALIDTKYCEVKNNYIHHTVREGILIHGWGDHGSMDSSHNKIINNTIVYAGTYAGITLGGDYNLLEGNDISNTIQCPMGYDSTATGKDADGVKFSGKGHIIRGNYIHDLVQFYSGPEGDNNGSCRSDCEPAHHDCWQSTKAVSDAIFEDNICDLDDDRQFYYSRTLCRTCEPGETDCISWNPYQGILMSSSSGAVTNVTFRNNIWEGKGAVLKVHATTDWPADDIIIAHNNFIGSRSGYAIEVTRSNNVVVKNNLIYEVLSGGGHYIGGVIGTGIEIGNNLIYVSNGTVSSNYPNDRYEEPRLTDIPNGNYHPLPGSPVIDSGVDVGIINDYDGNPRPIDGDNNGSAEFDIGAYEYAGGTPGDLNNDGYVDILDLGIVAGDFGKTSGYNPDADVVEDGEIDVFDLVFVASRFT